MKTGRNPPLRSLVYQCAEAWHIPPWEVMQGNARWFYRWIHERNLRAQLENPTIYPDED